jgi:hypothetical protein
MEKPNIEKEEKELERKSRKKEAAKRRKMKVDSASAKALARIIRNKQR